MDDMISRKYGTSLETGRLKCFFSLVGADQKSCLSITTIPMRNRQCHLVNCRSPWCRCKACVRDGGDDPNPVKDFDQRLCDFHMKNGEAAKRPSVSDWYRQLEDRTRAAVRNPTVDDRKSEKPPVKAEVALGNSRTPDAGRVEKGGRPAQVRAGYVRRGEKIDAIRRAKQALGSRMDNLRTVAKEAAKLINQGKDGEPLPKRRIGESSMYAFLSGKLLDHERRSLGLPPKQRNYRSFHRAPRADRLAKWT